MGAEWDGLGGRSLDGECHFERETRVCYTYRFRIYVSDTPCPIPGAASRH